MFHFSDEPIRAEQLGMARRSHSFDLAITAAVVWVHMLLTHVTGGVSTLGTFALWATVVVIGGVRLHMLRRQLRPTTPPPVTAPPIALPSEEDEGPIPVPAPATATSAPTAGIELDDEIDGDADLGTPDSTPAFTAADHPCVVSLDVLTTRFEHLLVRRPAATDVVGVAVIEATRAEAHELTDAVAGELRLSIIERFERRLDMADSLAVTERGRFVVLIDGPESKTALLARIRGMVESIQRPHHVGGLPEELRARAGVAFADQDHRDVDLLIRQARQSLGLTLAGDVEVFGGAEHCTKVDRHELAADLARAMRDDHLSVSWQPIVDVTTHEVVELEALTRWNHPTRGVIGPETFIPLADDTGLSVHLHHWLVETTVRQLREWQLEHPGLGVKVALNVSATQLRDPGLVEELRRTCERHHVSPSCIVLEVSERSITNDLLPQLDAVASIGAGIALDDFGTGSQSLADLETLPLTSVKIDRSVVAGFGDGNDHIASAIVELGGLMGLPMIAEGVERPEQAARLAGYGFAMAQGHLFDRPMPTAAMTALLGQLTETGGRLQAPAALIVD